MSELYTLEEMRGMGCIRVGWRGWFIPGPDCRREFYSQPQFTAIIAKVNEDGTVNIGALNKDGVSYGICNAQVIARLESDTVIDRDTFAMDHK